VAPAGARVFLCTTFFRSPRPFRAAFELQPFLFQTRRSFGAAQAIEGQYALKTGQLVPMSQQALMDCSWGKGNNACDGGEAFR
jgi:hypothetical protein